MRIVENVTQLIGETPIVKLNKLMDHDMADVYVKLEFFNPGGSVKDRIALAMIEEAERKGLINKDTVIVEPTSGNTGIGLAMIAAVKNYKLILVMPETMSIERRKLMMIYGAEIILTSGSLGMKGAVEKARELVNINNNYYMPLQFENYANPAMHQETTALEIVDQMGDSLDAFVAGVGTGGTITGVSRVIKNHYKRLTVIAVEPDASSVLSGGAAASHKIQGIGAGFVPLVLDEQLIDEIIRVTDEDAIQTARKLAKYEGILAGISSGAAVYAALETAKRLGRGKKVLTIAPDTGERYLSTEMYD